MSEQGERWEKRSRDGRTHGSTFDIIGVNTRRRVAAMVAKTDADRIIADHAAAVRAEATEAALREAGYLLASARDELETAAYTQMYEAPPWGTEVEDWADADKLRDWLEKQGDTVHAVIGKLAALTPLAQQPDAEGVPLRWDCPECGRNESYHMLRCRGCGHSRDAEGGA